MASWLSAFDVLLHAVMNFVLLSRVVSWEKVELYCIGSWSLPFHLPFNVSNCMEFVKLPFVICIQILRV